MKRILPTAILIGILSCILVSLFIFKRCHQQKREKKIKVKKKAPACKKDFCIEPPVGYESMHRLVLYKNAMIPQHLLKACPHAPIVVVYDDTKVECQYGTDDLRPYVFKMKPHSKETK